MQKLCEEQDLVLKTLEYLLHVCTSSLEAAILGKLSLSSQSAKLSLHRVIIGMAAIGTALWKCVLRYAPHTPDYMNHHQIFLFTGQSSTSPLRRGKRVLAQILRLHMIVLVHVAPPHRLQSHDL